jgi:hypothetical protein
MIPRNWLLLTIFAPDLSKISHTFGMPASTGNLSSLDPELVGEVLDTMLAPSIELLMVAAVSWG